MSKWDGTPGFMGLRGLDTGKGHDLRREEREERREVEGRDHEIEKRTNEKVQEILRDQEGDMSAFNPVTSGETQGLYCTIVGRTVREIMSGRVAVISFDDTLLTVQGIFSSVRFHHLPVVDAGGNIIGIISDRDFFRHASPFFGTVNEQNRDKELMNRKVGTIMTRNPICVDPDIAITKAIHIMNDNLISCLPIVEKDSRLLEGIVTWKDIVRAVCPDAFKHSQDSVRLKAGVNTNSEASESARLRAKASESARLRAPIREEERPPVIVPGLKVMGDGTTGHAGRPPAEGGAIGETKPNPDSDARARAPTEVFLKPTPRSDRQQKR